MTAMTLSLEIHDRRSGEVRRNEWSEAVLSIGKSVENGLSLPQQEISRRHCVIERQGGGWAVRDLGSRNGTFLDGQRLEPERPALFGPGQELRVGDYLLRLSEPESARPTPTPGAVRRPRAEASEVRPAFAEPRRVTPVPLKKKVHAALLNRMDLKHTDLSDHTSDELRLRAEQVCTGIVQELSGELPVWLTPAMLVKEVVDEAVGLGPLEELLDEESVDEIMVNGWAQVFVERRGKLELTDRQFMDDAQVISIIRRILAPLGRRIDETNPMADGRLADGSRVNAIVPPLALSGPTLTIRKFGKTAFTIDDLVGKGSLIRPMAIFLELAVRYRANMLISGGTGSGKTTLLNVTSNFIPHNERIVTVEDAAELRLQQTHVVRLESRPANLEGKNGVAIRDLVRNSLRMRPDRIVVGECRGGEALDMLQAMNTGHDGSLTTLHANSPRDALARLETLVLMAGMELPARAIREQICSAVDFIVQISRFPDGTRKVTHITGVEGMEGDIIQLQNVFVYEQKGITAEGRVEGRHAATGQIPEFVQQVRLRGVDVDLGMFREEPA